MKRREKEAGQSNMIKYGDDGRLDYMGKRRVDRPGVKEFLRMIFAYKL